MNWGPPLTCLFLGLQLAQLPACAKEVVLGRVGSTVELPCKAPKNSFFNWKFQSQGTSILRNRDSSMTLKGLTRLQQRISSPKRQWDDGSYPLVISNLELGDTDTYICEVQGQRMLVELRVFALTVTPHTHLLLGQSLTLTLKGPTREDLQVMWNRPGSKRAEPGGLSFSVAHVRPQDSGTWTCTFSQDQKQLDFTINILVMGFQKAPATVYACEDQPAVFTFPLNFEAEDLAGTLRWQGWGASSSQAWIRFSLKGKKVSVQEEVQDPKLKMGETLPLNFTLPRAAPHYAGTGNLSLTLSRGTLSQEVRLVVMRVTKSQYNLTCEARRPASPPLMLSLRWRNQTRALSQQTLVKVQNPETGTWQCVLLGQDGPLLMSEVKISPAALEASSTFLSMVLGGAAGFLLLACFCAFCCIRCWHRRRQAQRMSQIKRLLSEKKTCSCPHRLQKARGLI